MGGAIGLIVEQAALLPSAENLKSAPAIQPSFAELTEVILAERRQVARLWHPAPEGTHYMLPNGVNVEVNEGQEAAYQLTTGEVVKDF